MNTEVENSVICPFCGQSFSLVLDTSIPEQHFTSDCEVCCRPLAIRAICEPGEILSLEIDGA